ncbi:MAG: guanylate cyclase, partial [Acidimicrobiia bacterium]
AIGDTVNVASRLEAANKETGTNMLVTDIVFKDCGPDVDFGQSFDLDLRGKTGLVVAHEVIGVKNEGGT